MSHYDEQEQIDVVRRELDSLCKKVALEAVDDKTSKSEWVTPVKSAGSGNCHPNDYFKSVEAKKKEDTFRDSIDAYYKEKIKEDREVDRPFHYTAHPSGVECIQITEHMNFCLGNAMKYIWRAGIKAGQAREKDLRKALWYISRELDREFKL